MEINLKAGCTVSLLLFTVAMEVIIRASKWVVGGENLLDGTQLLSIKAIHG